MAIQSNGVTFDLTQFIEFRKNLTSLGGNLEETINKYLKEQGVLITEKQIYTLMPRSKDKQVHAKDSKSLKHIFDNLSFVIAPQKKFNYLVFPNDALGTSYLKSPQLFFERGLGETENKILEGIMKAVEIEIERRI